MKLNIIFILLFSCVNLLTVQLLPLHEIASETGRNCNYTNLSVDFFPDSYYQVNLACDTDVFLFAAIPRTDGDIRVGHSYTILKKVEE